MKGLPLFLVSVLSGVLCLVLTQHPMNVAARSARSTPMPAAATPFPEPAECKEPPADYRKEKLNGYTVNHRTAAMLAYAAELYDGEIDLLGSAITQGSYNNSVAESFGTHAGGGVVDISILAPNSTRFRMLKEDVPALVKALRLAGFAAWFRDLDELFPGSPMHIHAVAIGDRELSRPALKQISGGAGYFRGYDGLPYGKGSPGADRFGGPLICRWMIPYLPVE